MAIEIIHHYTNITTLALILKNRTIRFNRLDKVDDITEGTSFTSLKLDRFMFISCWTYDQNESLPQWSMYTGDMAGVRISLPVRMFDYKPLVVPAGLENKILKAEGVSPLPFEKIFADNYFIIPIFFADNQFGREVEYVTDFVERKNEAIKKVLNSEGKMQLTIADPTGIVSLKSPDWAIQKEYRFVLFIIPTPNIPRDEKFIERFGKEIPNYFASSLHQGKGPIIDFIDVDLCQVAINGMKVITGPMCSEGDYSIVEALLEKYSPSCTIEKSRFTGTIRKSVRK
jgi:hypothetical protein